MRALEATLTVSCDSYALELPDDAPVDMALATAVTVTNCPAGAYSGAYTVTPGRTRQLLQTAGRHLMQNVVIEPIPANYGLITWNGSVMTVT